MKSFMKIDVADWIVQNRIPYDTDDLSWLAGPTEATNQLWARTQELMVEEASKGVLDVDTVVPSSITSHDAGYIDKDLEVIVGFQGSAPLQRTMKMFGGYRICRGAAESYGYTVDPSLEQIFTEYVKTHNDAVFETYLSNHRLYRKVGIITGLPDGYGRGRIIGDYRMLALYGAQTLMEWKAFEKEHVIPSYPMSVDNIRLHRELTWQIKALKKIVKMGQMYGYDLSRPAQNAHEAIQWTYFAYLASIKEQDGAAMSFGRPDNFFDIFIEKDIASGLITEAQAQEMIDHFIMKLRCVRHLRTPAYNELFAGDPTWVTIVLGGVDSMGEHMVCKTTYRIMQSLYNLGPAPEPNMTILWSSKLPTIFKRFCTRVSIDTSSIQYENDDLMRPIYGSDYAIACCVSAMRIGREMQFFGARCNMPKLLLYTLNGGYDCKSSKQVGPVGPKLCKAGEPLDFDAVMERFHFYMEWLAQEYVSIMNIIHNSHDLYSYEAIQMAFHQTYVHRFMAFGIAGLSTVADSFSAMKFGQVVPILDEAGNAVEFETTGDFPCYGNNDERVDTIANYLVQYFMTELRKHETYRDSEHSMSLLTITSNVVYGTKTKSTPDGRKAGEPLAPGANPGHGRDQSGAIASLASVAHIDYDHSRDGISLTSSFIPSALGKTKDEQIDNLCMLLDGYFDMSEGASRAGHHINVNVLTRETLRAAIEHPEDYQQLTIRVSGYAVRFVLLDRAKQEEVIARTFHDKM